MIMIKKSLWCSVILLLIGLGFAKGQILQQYPRSQVPYVGGYEAFYEDFHQIVKEKELQPCQKTDEFYQLSLLINANGSVNFVKDHNSNYISANKCAYDLARTAVQYLKKWNPATVDGVAKSAVATFYIFPADFFSDVKPGYYPSIRFPRYGKTDKGDAEFRKGIVNRIDTRRFSWDDRFEIIADFIISKDSKISDVVIIKSSSSEELDKRVVYGIQSTNKKWTAATVNGVPVDYKYRLKLTAITDPE